MKRHRVQVSVFLLGVAVVTVLTATRPLMLVELRAAAREDDRREDEDDDDEDEVIEELMEKLHEGRRSPYKQIRTALDADLPAWKSITRHLPAFDRMSNQLRKAKDEDVRDAADGYIDAVAELANATKKKDAVAARQAFKALAGSCADCHFKGGPGGKLDD